MCIQRKTGGGSVNLALIPVFKPNTHKLYILRHCINIYYPYIKIEIWVISCDDCYSPCG